MLVLTRKHLESIMIGDEIEVRVLAITRDTVRIGIRAPREVPVFRKEIYVEIAQGSPNRSSRHEVDEALKRLSEGR